jgi:S-adenosylmethionine hydrolase
MWHLLTTLSALLLMSCAGSPIRHISSETGKNLAPVVFQSDFGLLDENVAICKGVMLSVEPALTIIDLTHQVPAFSVRDAGRFVNNLSGFYPSGTVFLSLVDRHVGGAKKPIVVKTKKGQYFVQPDNGLVTLVADRDGIEEVREIAKGPWVDEKKLSSSFVWRDLYSPVAAHLARGEDFSLVGPVFGKNIRTDLKNLKVDDKGVAGEVVALELPFGNLITNVSAASLLNAGYSLGDPVSVSMGGKEYDLPFVKTFDDVPVNKQLLYIDSSDHVAIAINQGNFAKINKVKPPQPVLIKRLKKKKE